MKRALTLPADTLRDQALASDPDSSAWVSANAGSGKTHVLAQRVIRLLLAGTEPSKILCLTYTKAAAANMSNRVFTELARWTSLGEAELGDAVSALEGGRPDAAKLRLARRLFANALETPGGLKIQTIHAFCEAVLHQFPLEANIAGHFKMMDAGMEAALLAEARRDMLTGVADGDRQALTDAFGTVLQYGGEFGLDLLLSEILARRDGVRNFIRSAGGVEYSLLFEEFGFRAGDTEQSISAGLWPDAYFDAGLAEDIARAAERAGKAAAADFARDLARACNDAEPRSRFEKLCDLFTTWDPKAKAGKARSTRNIMAKGVGEHFPSFADEFERFATHLINCANRLALFRMLEATRAAMVLADFLIARYERLKSARGLLDFSDLITRTVALLSREDVGPWVQYKLDRGIDHILIDEAQDTSPDQWKVIAMLAGDFFAGKSAREVNRTIFAVGDEKQSIYSFQGADPDSFAVNRHEFGARVQEAERRFQPVRLLRSFRSTDDVLSAVDRVFAAEPARKGLTRDTEPISHRAIRENAPGYVEVWPLLEPQASDEPDDWAEPIDHATAPAVKLARHIAGTVQNWLEAGESFIDKEGRYRRLRAGDVMVLVRKRDRFVHALSRTLKDLQIPVAGADRLSLATHIAVQDLIALGRVALQPDDDLSLAALLRSPVFGLGEDQLFAIAWDRGPGVSLLSALRAKAESDAGFADIFVQLDVWRNEAAFKPVFEFYAGVLGRDGLRRKLIARLGREAGEILDEFLNFCLAEELAGAPGLEAFLATLATASPDIKREMDQTRDEVRIMTVHAAKGLEAPIVFLVDSGGAPFSDAHLPRLIPFDAKAWHGRGYLWRASADIANSVSKAINDGLAEKAEEEYRRLLYVGMTRAEDRLILCGYRGVRPASPQIWHRLVSDALCDHCKEIEHPMGFTALRHQVTEGRGPLSPAECLSAAPGEPAPEPLPPLPEPPRALSRLSPSGASMLLPGGHEPPAPRPSPVFNAAGAPSFAVERGLVIHRLLQSLPGLPPSAREAAAVRFLARAGAGWDDAERERAWTSVRTVMEQPEFAPVFAEGSRAEVSVMGEISLRARGYEVSGQIDRLSVTKDRVLIVDYKTNRPPPLTLSEVPPAYVAQLALYRTLLRTIYPDRAVWAALLFTEAPVLIAVPDDAMDASLERLTAA
jgi:ATP-dependent helicase/nuclease subunit A